jgi:hypothetical protein
MIGEGEMWDEKTERAGGKFMKRIKKKRQKYIILPVISHELCTSCSILEEDSLLNERHLYMEIHEIDLILGTRTQAAATPPAKWSAN